MRLDKYLAQAGVGTRSEVKKIIRSGRVFLNGEATKSPEAKVETLDEVSVDGQRIQYEEYEYYMLNKPQGVISATQDQKDKTVVDLITSSHSKDLFPVGRLDKDTEGLLLMTNDGVLAHDLLSPRKHVAKTYFVRVTGSLEEDKIKILEKGVDIGDDTLTKPAQICDVVSRGEEQKEEKTTELKITITEGRYHQIKRMFAKVGNPVIYLKRISMGTLILDDTLKLGAFRKLTQEEINLLKMSKNKKE